jgi:hypothetical protein
MLRISSVALKTFSMNGKKLPLLSQIINKNFQKIHYFFASAQDKSSFNQLLLSGKYYEVLGFDSNINIFTLSDIDVKKQYLAMIKKYHSDSVIDPVQKLEN